MYHREDFAERATRIKLVILDVDGVLTDARLYLGEQEELKAYSARDGLGITLLQVAGFRVGILTGRKSASVARRAAELRLDPVIQGRPDKLQAYDELLTCEGLEPSQVAYMGDDWIDLPLFGRVGVTACPADAEEEVRLRSDFVSDRNGGEGAVRQFAEALLLATGKYDAVLNQYMSGAGRAASVQQ